MKMNSPRKKLNENDSGLIEMKMDSPRKKLSEGDSDLIETKANSSRKYQSENNSDSIGFESNSSHRSVFESDSGLIGMKRNSSRKKLVDGDSGIDFDRSRRIRLDSFSNVNEKEVEDINLEFLYKPHTISLLIFTIGVLIYLAFVRDDNNVENNIWEGVLCGIFFFLIVSCITFPNGPFIRPHPIVWRIVFGLSVVYLLLIIFLLFQNYRTVRNLLVWCDPNLANFSIDMEKEYGVNCSVINTEKIWNHLDIFAFAHFFGWMFKAILIRHKGILWMISILWEITEIAFAHLLPNFRECWWDSLILDVIVCNGLGIECGLWLHKKWEMREYKWVSILDIHTTTGKIKRAVLQFTPESWSSVRWLDPKCSYMRVIAFVQLVFFWLVSELNTFFLKHVFEMPPSHPFVIGRLVLIGVIVAPSVRQYYTYVTDTQCKRLGTQCWVYGFIMVAESLLCIKHGGSLFEHTQAINIFAWLITQFLVSIVCVIACIAWQKHVEKQSELSYDVSPLKPKTAFLNESGIITTSEKED